MINDIKVSGKSATGTTYSTDANGTTTRTSPKVRVNYKKK